MTDFVETQASGFVLRVPSAGAKGGDVVVAIDHDRAVEISDAARIRGTDERVQRERGRAIAARESVDEGPHSGRLLRDGHGLIGLIGGNGTMDFGNGFPGVALARLAVLSAFGSTYTPEIESTFVTVATLLLSLNAMVIWRATT